MFNNETPILELEEEFLDFDTFTNVAQIKELVK